MRAGTLQIAWRNLGRNRRRTALALGAIALGQLTLVAINGMMAGMFDVMLRTVTGPMVGHAQIHHPQWREEQAPDLTIDRVDTVLRDIRALAGVTRASPRVYAPVLAAPGGKMDTPADAEIAIVIGVDTAQESGSGGILEGMSPASIPRGKGVLLGKVLATRLRLGPGSPLALIGSDADGFPLSDLFTVTAVIGSPADVVNRLGVVVSVADAQDLLAMPDRAHEIVIHGSDPETAEELTARVASLPSVAGMEVVSWKKAVPEITSIINLKDWVDLIFLAIVFLAAAAGIANTTMMSTFERRQEFGMLLALGAGPRRIIRMIAVESILLGLLGVAIGSALGAAVVLLTSHTGIDYGVLGGARGQELSYLGMNFSMILYPKFEVRHILYGVAAVTGTAVVTTTWPALLITRLQPARAMRS